MNTVNLEAGKPYKFEMPDGSSRRVIVRGSRSADAGTVWEVEVDGIPGEYSGLDQAIGEYVSVSKLGQ